MGTSYSAPDIYQRIRGGRGAGAFSSNGEITGEQATLQSTLNDQITGLNAKMNQAWQGSAADQAVSGAAPLANSADSASISLTQASNAMNNQVNAFSNAYNSVVPMASTAPPNNVVNQFVSALGVNTPLDQQISNYNSAGQHNVQVYNTYSTESAANAAQMPTSFGSLPEPHPTVTVIPGSATTRSAAYGTFTTPSGTGRPTSVGYRAMNPSASGVPAFNGPSGSSVGPSARVTMSGVPGPGGAWEPPGAGMPFTTTTSDYVPGGSGPGGGPGFMEPGFVGGPGGYGGNPANETYYPGMPGYNANQQNETVYPGGGPGGMNGPGGFTEPGGAFGGPGGLNGPGGAGGFGAGGPNGPGGAGFRGVPGSFGSGPGGTGSASAHSSNVTPAAEEALIARNSGLIGMPGPLGTPGEGGMIPPVRGARGEEDEEHKTAEYLQEADPDALFGSDQQTVPPVLGE